MEKNVTKQETSLKDKQKILAESGAIVGGVLLLCYFFGWSYVFNTSYGVEAGVNGWNYIIACFTWKFKSTGALYGDISLPFNYYAKYYVRVLCVMTTASLAVLIAFIIVNSFNIRTYNKKIEKACAALLYVLAGIFLGCIVTALSMNGSKILPKYCSGNPKCSIATLIFFPFFITLITAIVHSVFIHKSQKEVE